MRITTNQSVTQWGQVFGDAVIATSILDRRCITATPWSKARAIACARSAKRGRGCTARHPWNPAPDPNFVLSGHPRGTMECRLE